MAKYGTRTYYFASRMVGEISNPPIMIAYFFIDNLERETRRLFSLEREILGNVMNLASRFENYEKKLASDI